MMMPMPKPYQIHDSILNARPMAPRLAEADVRQRSDGGESMTVGFFILGFLPSVRVEEIKGLGVHVETDEEGARLGEEE
jgi:hypothetical protein